MKDSKWKFSSLLFTVLISCTGNSNKLDLDNISSENSVFEDTTDEGCKFDNGTYSATVQYYNSHSNYHKTYTLDVEVDNCEVVQINFPNGGWLDSDHITPSEIDLNGRCKIEGDDGKTYEIQIDK